MANLKGEVTFKVTFNNLGVPASMYSSAIIHKECAEQVFANAPLSNMSYKKKRNFCVEMINKKIERDL
jgi:hypothetical protein